MHDGYFVMLIRCYLAASIFPLLPCILECDEVQMSLLLIASHGIAAFPYSSKAECRRNRSFCMYFHCRLRCLFLDILKKGIWPFGCKGAFREKVTQCKGVRLTAR